MRADVCTQGNRLGGRTGPTRVDVFAVFFAQAVEIRCVQRIVRHAREIRLRQVDCAATSDRRKKISQRGQVSILMVVFVTLARIGILVFIQRFPHFVSGLIEAPIDFFTGFSGARFCFVQSLTGIVLQLVHSLAGLFARLIVFALRTSAEDEGKEERSRDFHQQPAVQTNYQFR